MGVLGPVVAILFLEDGGSMMPNDESGQEAGDITDCRAGERAGDEAGQCARARPARGELSAGGLEGDGDRDCPSRRLARVNG
jgi:hypothetical protein